MDKNKINYLIDLGLLLSFIIAFISGIIKLPAIKHMLGFGHNSSIQMITTVHDVSGIIMGILVLIHIGLHWKWIGYTTKMFLEKRDKVNK